MTTTISPLAKHATSDRLALMLFIASAFHALIILGISFDPFDRDPPDSTTPMLDITIVNRNDTPPPKEYDYLAESSQDGAGNTQEKIKPQQQLAKQTTAASAQKPRPAERKILTRQNNQRKVDVQPKPEVKPKPAQPTSAELINRSMEMLALNEQINQTAKSFSNSKKSKFISSRTKEFKYASYMRDWVTKVERVGELNYPDAARRSNLSGKLIVEVGVYPDGSVRNITVLNTSGHKILDDAAVRIVKLSAPFAPFPDNIRKETDILYITRTWVFTSGNRLQSR